jgi:Zn-finger nucleic acid-binding protein
MTIKCPRCDKNLMNVDRQGIAVDYCPKCKGVWLDKEELDEIIKRTSGIFSEVSDGTEDKFKED